MHRTGLVIIFCTVLICAGVCLLVGGGIWYTRTQVQHECKALKIITTMPVPRPVTQQQKLNYEFHQALVEWAKADGC